MDRARGIDVSHYQTVTSWSDIYDSGVSYVGVKATQGNTFVDPKLSEHRSGARSLPFVMAFYYHFASAGDPVTQANRFMDTVGELLPNERLCLDLEDDKTGKPTVDLVWAAAFFATLTPGRRTLLYTSQRIWSQLGNPSTWGPAPGIDLIVPRYGPDEPRVPSAWQTWSFWQNSEEGIVPGISGPCDTSVFNGDLDALKTYAALSPTPAP